MAKRGRKKKFKVFALSSVDKAHLSRILKKVRQIKSNKAATQQFPGQASQNKAQLQAAYNVANQTFLNFVSRGLDLTTPTNKNTFDLLSRNLAAATAALLNG